MIWRAQAVALLLTAPLGVPAVLSAHWTLAPALAIVALGALGTGVAFVVAAVAAGRLGATTASATAFLMPGVALVLGLAIRNERVAVISMVGSAISIAGAWMIRRATVA